MGMKTLMATSVKKCGSSLNPTDLINPVSTLSGKTPELRTTKHWFLPLDKYQEWMEKWLVGRQKGQMEIQCLRAVQFMAESRFAS